MGARSGIVIALVMGMALSAQEMHRPDSSIIQLGLFSTDNISVLEGVSLFGDGQINKLGLVKGSKLHSAGKESLRDTIQTLKLKNIQKSGNGNNQQSKKEKKSSEFISNLKKNTEVNSQKNRIASKKSDRSTKENEMTSLSRNSKKKTEQKMRIIDEDGETNEALKSSVSFISQRILTAALPSLKSLIPFGKSNKESSKTTKLKISPDQVDEKSQLVKFNGQLITREELEKMRAKDTAVFLKQSSFEHVGNHNNNNQGLRTITKIITNFPAKNGKENQGLAHKHSQHAVKTASVSLDGIRKMDDSSGIQGLGHQTSKAGELQDSALSFPKGKSHFSRKILSHHNQHQSGNHHQHQHGPIQLQSLLLKSKRSHKQTTTQNQHHQPSAQKSKSQNNLELHNGHHQSSEHGKKQHKDQTPHSLRTKKGSNDHNHHQRTNLSIKRHLQINPNQAKFIDDQIIVPTVVSHRNGDDDGSLPPRYRSGNSGRQDFAYTLKMSGSRNSALTSASSSASPQPARVTVFEPKKRESDITGVALFSSVKNGQVNKEDKWVANTKGPLGIDISRFQAARNKFSNQKQACEKLLKRGNSNTRSGAEEQMSDLTFTKQSKNRRKYSMERTTGEDSWWERNE